MYGGLGVSASGIGRYQDHPGGYPHDHGRVQTGKAPFFFNFTDLQILLILTPIFANFRTLMRVPLVEEWGYRGINIPSQIGEDVPGRRTLPPPPPRGVD